MSTVPRSYEVPAELDKQITLKAKLLGITKTAVVIFALERFVYDMDQLQRISWDEIYRLMDERKAVDEDMLDDDDALERVLAGRWRSG